MKHEAPWIFFMGYISILSAKFNEKSKEDINVNVAGLPPNSLFGYSVAYEMDKKRLIISAPRANNVGRVFIVDMVTRNTSEVKIDISSREPGYNHDYWLGATIKTGPDYFLTCAPLYGYQLKVSPNFYLLDNKCFMVDDSGRRDILPDLSSELNNIPKKEHKGLGFGWSIDITPNGEALFGAKSTLPGWVMVYEKRPFDTTPRLITLPEDIKANTFNFGYSIATGNYLSSQSDSLQYALSSTNADDGLGKVYFYSTDKTATEYIDALSSPSIGSMYGTALCTVRLEKGVDSLLVGAPTYVEQATKNGYSRGAVFVYSPFKRGNKKQKELQLIRVIDEGTQDGGYFGSALVNIGDMDGDGLDEVAIGAPYEDEGRGAVYIYTGYGIVNEKSHIQRLQPGGKYKSFGLSLAVVQDIDENGCNDLVVGAPFVNKVVFYKCISYITIKVRAVEHENQATTTKSTLEVCLDVQFPKKLKKINAGIKMNFQILHADENGLDDLGTIFSETYIQSLHDIKSSLNLCRKFEINATEVLMKYTVSAELDQSAKEGNLKSNILLSEHSIKSFRGTLSSNVKPKLIMNYITKIPSTYIIGSSSTESFSLKITNQGDDFFGGCVIVDIQGADIQKAPCTIIHRTRLECVSKRVIKTNGEWDINNITLQMFHLTNQDTNIQIHTSVYNYCNKQTEEPSDEKVETIDLRADVNGIEIKGNTVTEKFFVTNMNIDGNTSLEHVYNIVNGGQTNFKEVTCEISFESHDLLNLIVPPITIDGEKCIRDEKSGQTKQICDINLSKKQIVRINVPFQVHFDKLDKLRHNEVLEISTLVTLKLGQETKSMSVTTQCIPRFLSVPLWIIIVSLLFGVLLVLIVAFILYEDVYDLEPSSQHLLSLKSVPSFGLEKCNFLQRKNKQKLKELKRDVYRQSQIRNSRRRTAPDEIVPLTAPNEESVQSLLRTASSSPKKRR